MTLLLVLLFILQITEACAVSVSKSSFEFGSCVLTSHVGSCFKRRVIRDIPSISNKRLTFSNFCADLAWIMFLSCIFNWSNWTLCPGFPYQQRFPCFHFLNHCLRQVPSALAWEHESLPKANRVGGRASGAGVGLRRVDGVSLACLCACWPVGRLREFSVGGGGVIMLL